MTTAHFTLTLAETSHDAALAQAEALEQDLRFDALAVVVNEVDEAKATWVTVAYFETEGEATAVRDLLGADSVVAEIPDVDWVRESLKGLAPVAAGRFFLHGSHDRAIRRSGGITLEIDAGTAFGTGHHGTTAGCLQALDLILKRRKPRKIFDLGCGTGVLAIAATRATRTASLATDIDPEAVRVTQLNAALNGVAPMVRTATAPGLKHAVIAASAPYDLIFANILARPLASLAPGLSRLLASGGELILSGLTRNQIRWITACYMNQGLILQSRIVQGNWAAIVMTRKGQRRGKFLRSAGPGWELD
jgi:ribosomal protein L11 methyltransferase